MTSPMGHTDRLLKPQNGGSPWGATFVIVLPLTWRQRLRIATGAQCAVRVGIETPRWPGKAVQVGAEVVVGKVKEAS